MFLFIEVMDQGIPRKKRTKTKTTLISETCPIKACNKRNQAYFA